MEKYRDLSILYLMLLLLQICCNKPLNQSETVPLNSLAPDIKMQDHLIDLIVTATKSSECPLVNAKTKGVGDFQESIFYRNKESIAEELKKGTDEEIDTQIDKLAETLIMANKKITNIARIKSCEKDGFIFSDDAKYNLSKNSHFQGAEIIKNNPHIKEILSYSSPVYDPETKLLLVYVQWYCGDLCAKGQYMLFKLQNDKLIKISTYTTFIS